MQNLTPTLVQLAAFIVVVFVLVWAAHQLGLHF
jgi:hypothetical protein